MIGFGANKGIIPTVCEELFQAIENQGRHQEHQIRDLLSRTKKPGGLRVREDQQLGFYVEGLKLVPCQNYAQIERLMEQGTKIRTTASTNMNASSSRSHLVITIQFKQVFLEKDLTKQSSINLVDLAGSKRQKSSGSEGDRPREGSRVNLSLTNLGNVISALADAAVGKKVLHVPYRDSVLTKPLQSALGRNSRTALIAAVSPADICYEETSSTLRYAERAKKIRNKAVVNTWTLMRESRAENSKLLPRCRHSIMSEPEPSACLRAEPQLGTPADQATWAHLLEQAQERQMMTFPHLNVNEDPQLTGVLKYFIQPGSCDAGRAASDAITIQGLGISDKHASFTNADGKVTVTPHSKCKVAVNGVPIATRTKLQHLDRLILGSNSTYLYVGFPSERGSEDLSRFDHDFFQSERAAAEGVSADKLGAADRGDGKADPSVLAAFQDYIKLMPLVAEANQMSEELKKGLNMELKVKNLASSDSKGYDLQKEVLVKVTHHGTHEVWIWSKAKFINRKFLMEELYQRFLDGDNSPVAQEDDPFWDPVEVVHLGSAHVWLQSLAYCMKLEEQVEFLNCDGLEEAVLHICIAPCSPTGQTHGEEDVVIDPLELLGKRMDFQIHIVRCLGVSWMKEDAKRGIQIGCQPAPRNRATHVICHVAPGGGSPVFLQVLKMSLSQSFLKFLFNFKMTISVTELNDLPNTIYIKPVWRSVNSTNRRGDCQFAALTASQEFLNYLETNALYCLPMGPSRHLAHQLLTRHWSWATGMLLSLPVSLPTTEGCTELSCSQLGVMVTGEGHILVDTKKISTVKDPSQAASDQIPEPYLKLLKLEQETELLRNINRALREENVLLKESLAKTASGQAQKPSDTLKVSGMTAQLPSARETSQMCTQQAGSDRELAQALKVFYQSMNAARGQLFRLRRYKPPEDDQMLRPFVNQRSQMFKDLGDLLESSLWKLKKDVALIVKKKREYLLHVK
ncbi:PREDICTED: kinesin-like protein KIF28P [Cercocebus atys]|uniref:kinesin-like protein KIF28P n=1 Tax=Cercocebus atys TaxID=9531 RepID=UPI0005F53C5B|nr:PREDICTED: kinesin-like protein KIF28P [Cercocebus atys]